LLSCPTPKGDEGEGPLHLDLDLDLPRHLRELKHHVEERFAVPSVLRRLLPTAGLLLLLPLGDALPNRIEELTHRGRELLRAQAQLRIRLQDELNCSLAATGRPRRT
jgi:hypothetical protein